MINPSASDSLAACTISDGSDGDLNLRIGANLPLQRTDSLPHLLLLFGLNRLLKIEANGQPRIGALNRVNDAQVRTRLLSGAVSEPEHAFRVLAEADCANQFPMLHRPGHNSLGVQAGFYRAICLIENPGGS